MANGKTVYENKRQSFANVVELYILRRMGDGFGRWFWEMVSKIALKTIKKCSRLEDISQIQGHLQNIDFQQIRKIFLNPKVADVDEISFNKTDCEAVANYQVKDKSFSVDSSVST